MRGEGWGVGARNRFSLRGPSWEGRRPSVCSARVIAARGWDRARRETPGVKVGGEGWITQLGAGRGEGGDRSRLDGPLPPGSRSQNSGRLFSPGLGEGAPGGEEGAYGGRGRLL